MHLRNRIIRLLPPGMLALSLVTIYLLTLAPGLTWADYGADGGDLISAAASGGIAHPTGYPTYLLLARLFQDFPIGSLAYRTNVMSALAGMSTAVFIYRMVTILISDSRIKPRWLPGFIAGSAFGLAPMVWSQAVITEVYSLNSLFFALILFLLFHPVSRRFTQLIKDCSLGLVMGLALGNHLTSAVLLPLLLANSIKSSVENASDKSAIRRVQFSAVSLLRMFASLGIGLLVYLILPLRAMAHPPIDWGNPVNLRGFAWLVSGQEYHGQLFGLTANSMLQRLEAEIGAYYQQFGIIGLMAGVAGSIIFFKTSRLYFSLLWIWLASSTFALIYGTGDSFLYLIPAFMSFTVWIGAGFAGGIKAFADRIRYSGFFIGLVFLSALAIQTWQNWAKVDASLDTRAESFGRSVLSIAPENAIVFAKGDQAVFSLWYFRFGLHSRPDLTILATDLLQFNWYTDNLHFTYPDLAIPGQYPFASSIVVANPKRPVCYVQYYDASEINCLPAGNTPSP